MEHDFLTKREAWEALRISEYLLDKLIRNDQIKAVRLGERRLCIRRAEVDRVKSEGAPV